MTLAQMRMWLREGAYLERRSRAAHIRDVNAAMPGPMGECDKAQEAIADLLGE